ncbi:hypothetical protein SAMN06265348_103301 [Pedobacter westerhofensis]|uniref:Uncharacterized protein n=1 Tax=Pedobacter westerhofensis TaxID=425512 RepID=A0A521C850_9SPHI|nr:hypothetical protein [Pedobacter westerhofensis]SMO55596.1 hypothetical protein SAMN06265348_103301 [Pedobacter westerhofensis]
MNQVLMGFLIAGTALGGSALTNVESHTTAMNGKTLAPGLLCTKSNKQLYLCFNDDS